MWPEMIIFVEFVLLWLTVISLSFFNMMYIVLREITFIVVDGYTFISF
jgi:hypothetical protein